VAGGKLVQFEIPAKGDRLTVAYVVETARPGDYPGKTPSQQARSFAKAADACFDRLRFDASQPSPEVRYEAVDATEMHLGWRPRGTSSIREIHGRPVPDIEDDAQWPLLGTPYITQPVNGNLTLHTDEGVVEYDFTNWTVKRPAAGRLRDAQAAETE